MNEISKNEIKNQKSIAGLRANAVAFLVNLSFFSGLGIIFSILALILEPNNEFVRKYSKQTLALNVLFFASFFLNIFIFIGTFIFVVFSLIIFVVQIIAIIYSALGKDLNIPVLNKLLNKITDFLFVD